MYSIFHSTYLIYYINIFGTKNAFYVKSKKAVYSDLTYKLYNYTYIHLPTRCQLSPNLPTEAGELQPIRSKHYENARNWPQLTGLSWVAAELIVS